MKKAIFLLLMILSFAMISRTVVSDEKAHPPYPSALNSDKTDYDHLSNPTTNALRERSVYYSENIFDSRNVVLFHDQKLQMVLDSSNTAEFMSFQTGASYQLTLTCTYMPENQWRPVYLSYFWEDTERDDLDNAPCCEYPLYCGNVCNKFNNNYLFYR
jgi:hypothetical protein